MIIFDDLQYTKNRPGQERSMRDGNVRVLFVQRVFDFLKSVVFTIFRRQIGA